MVVIVMVTEPRNQTNETLCPLLCYSLVFDWLFQANRVFLTYFIATLLFYIIVRQDLTISSKRVFTTEEAYFVDGGWWHDSQRALISTSGLEDRYETKTTNHRTIAPS